MKQLLQNLKTGDLLIEEVPVPVCKANGILVETAASVVSPGTERMLIDFAKSSILGKVKSRPDLAKQVLEKMSQEGVINTLEKVFSRLESPLPLGYSTAGIVKEVGAGARDQFQPGEKVACGGAGYANHAEFNYVPKNLAVKIPDGIPLEEAAFTTIGAIALQGVRQATPMLGERFAVVGLGLLGLLTVQLLKASGCRVIGADLDDFKLELARRLGCDEVCLAGDLERAALGFSQEHGVDGVIICAATQSNKPIVTAGKISRLKGRIVAVGVCDLNIPRDLYYKKELELRLSMSYGPGRYDPTYEQKGVDYPFAYVRWTEKRNMEAFLDLLAQGKVNVRDLITHRFSFDKALQAYRLLEGEGKEPFVGIVLSYTKNSRAEEGEIASSEAVEDEKERTQIGRKIWLEKAINSSRSDTSRVTVGFIGVGSFAKGVLLPALNKVGGVELLGISSSMGTSATFGGKKYGFRYATSRYEEILADKEINTVFIVTPHNLHARMTIEALKTGKNVFVEKPLCLSSEELNEIKKLHYSRLNAQGTVPLLMVGFNRRFAPQVQKMKELLDGIREPKSMIMTVNAGKIPPDHWIQDPEVGGGRIIGEACHFVDLMRYLTGHRITAYSAWPMKSPCNDTVVIQLGFEDGSIATIHYLSNGHRRFPKERLEIFVEGRIIQLDNFRKLRAYGWPSFKKMNLWRQDKGHVAEVAEFINAVQKGLSSPIPYDEIEEVSRICIDLDRQVRG